MFLGNIPAIVRIRAKAEFRRIWRGLGAYVQISLLQSATGEVGDFIDTSHRFLPNEQLQKTRLRCHALGMDVARIEYQRDPEGVEVREICQGGYGISRDGRLWRFPRPNKRRPGWVAGTGRPLRYYVRSREPMALASRLVAEAWLQNPGGLPFVRFRDGNPCNVCVDNLYWSKTTGGGRLGRRIICRETGQVFDSIKDAGMEFSVAPSQISAHLAGRSSHVKNLTFLYVDNERLPNWRQALATQ